MQAKKHTFKNGLRLISVPLKSTASVTVMVAVAAGSRYEEQFENGLSHFMEHMFFKGAKRYPNTLAVSSAIEGKGGVFNAFTGNEMVAYYIKLASHHAPFACDVLSDMLIHAKCPPSEIKRERGVIIEEINMYEDDPASQVAQDFDSLLFADHPLGRPILGPKKNILALQRKDFMKFRKDFYAPDNLVVVMTGNISHNKAKQLTEKYFRFPATKKKRDYLPFTKKEARSCVYIHPKKTEQAHLVLGGFGYDFHHPLKYASGLLSIILGGGMSSRLFIEVRERRGLCYYIGTHEGSYQDIGQFVTSAGVNIEKTEMAVKEIVKQYKKVMKNGITAAELRRAKDLILGRSALNYENSFNVANLFAGQELLKKQLLSTEELAKKIEAVTKAQVNEAARDLLKFENLYLALIGPFKKQDEARFAKLLAAK